MEIHQPSSPCMAGTGLDQKAPLSIHKSKSQSDTLVTPMMGNFASSHGDGKHVVHNHMLALCSAVSHGDNDLIKILLFHWHGKEWDNFLTWSTVPYLPKAMTRGGQSRKNWEIGIPLLTEVSHAFGPALNTWELYKSPSSCTDETQ
jgi:hypothetical protein